MTDHQLPSGWFPDPLERYDHRWFNGTTWTSDVSVNGQRFVDPLGTSPNPRSGGGTSGNRSATAALVCGLVAVAIAWIPLIVVAGIVLALLAIVFGAKGIRQARDTGVGKGRAVTGLISGIVAVGLAIVGVFLTISVFREVIAYVEPGLRLVDDVACTVDGRDAVVEGTITNLDDEQRSYTVFVDVGGRTEYDTVDDVDPGEVATWSVAVRTRTEVDDCDPEITVNGPFPWGIETDPYRN